MDTDCILYTKEGQFVRGIGSGDHVDFIKIEGTIIPDRKGFWIGFLPESIFGKKVPVYVEDEEMYNVVKKNWT